MEADRSPVCRHEDALVWGHVEYSRLPEEERFEVEQILNLLREARQFACNMERDGLIKRYYDYGDEFQHCRDERICCRGVYA